MKKLIGAIIIICVCQLNAQNLVKATYPIHKSTIADTNILIQWSLFSAQNVNYQYRLVLATDSNFVGQIVNDFPIYVNQYAVVLQNNRQYFYKVIGYGKSDTIYTSIQTFSTMNVLGIGSLVINLDSENAVSVGNVISQINDISSRGNHAAQTNINLRPNLVLNQLNGKPAIRFDGVNDFLLFKNAIDSIKSVFWIFKDNRIGTGAYYRFLLGGYTTFNFHRGSKDALFDGNANVPVKSGTFKLNSNTINGVNTGLPADICHLSLKTFNGFAAANNFSSDRLNPGRVWDGDLYDLLIFKDTFVDAVYTRISSSLMDKYAPPVTLGEHRSVCTSTATLSAANSAYRNWLWSNGDTSSSITVNITGFYSVRVRDVFNRFSFDTIYIRFDTTDFRTNLGRDTSICFGQNSLLNAGPKHLNYLWNTGDTSNMLSINQTGFYSVSVKNCKNNTFKDTVYLFVSNNKPNLADTGILCFNATKTLNPNIPNQALKYLWSNGDTTKTISIQNGGVYYLQVKDTFNCTFNDTIAIYTDSVLKNTTLGPNLNLCSGNTIGLISENFVKSYLWNNASTANRIQVNATGNYWVKVADSNACSISDTLSVTIIGNAPQMKLAVSKVCTNEFTSFKDLSIPPSGNSIVNQLWRFSATDSSLNKEDSFRFGSNGNKSIYHRVTTNVGCFSDTSFSIQIYNPPSAGFSSTTSCAQTNSFFVNKTSFDLGDSANMWMWSFGDGQNSSIQSPAIKYVNQGKFSIQLIAMSKRNCRDTAISELDIYPAFIAKFKTENNCQSDSTLFIDSTMSKSTVYWMWNFGDNSFSMERNPKHRYMNGGVYNVLMAVQNAIGCRDTLREAVTIVGRPKANIISGNGCYRDAYNFEESSIVGIGDSIVSYRWEISNAGVYDAKKPNYAFRDTGIVELKLRISTKFGCSDTTSKKIQILPSPIAGFSLSANAGDLPAKIITTNLSKNASSYLWKFGNNDSSTEISPTYTYFANGDYTIRLIASNSLNCKDVYELPFIVKPTQVDLLVDKLLIKEVKTADSALYYEMSIRLINIGSRPIYDIDLAISSLQRPDVIEHWKDTLMPSTNKTYVLNTRINAASSIYRNYICIEGKNVNFNQKESNVLNNKTCETVVNDIQMNIYPNPASTIAEILMVLPADGIVTFSLMDYRGERSLGEESQSYKKGFNSFKFDVSQLQRGMYFLRIDYSGNSKLVKFEVGE
ncbi:MAG: PKD domain-containing protein [Bacteroidetes bacterium]|nr:PKD domain-containing protein [Bacteroidota bacterium]